MIKPYYGQVIRTDSSGQYRDASDHNALLAKFSLDAATRAKVMTFNLHRSTADDPGHEWVKRQPKCVRLIADWRPSVACLQELDTSMHDELMGKLAEATGSPWWSLRNPNVAVAWMSDRWKLLASRTLNMDNADEPDRRLAMVLCGPSGHQASRRSGSALRICRICSLGGADVRRDKCQQAGRAAPSLFRDASLIQVVR